MLKPWEDIKSIININTTKNNSINCLNVNNTKEIEHFCSKQFLQHVFHNTAKKIESNIVHTPKTTQVSLQVHQRKTFFLTLTLPDEVKDIIKILNQENKLVQTVSQLNFSKNIPKLSVFQSPNALIIPL